MSHQIARRGPAGKPLRTLSLVPSQAERLLKLARAVERLGWDRAAPEQALTAKLGIRDELRRIAQEMGR